MTINTQKSRPGSIVAEAFRLKAIAERKEKKAPADVHKKPAEVITKAPDVHRKAGKVNKTVAKKAAKKTAKPPRAKGGKTISRK